MILVEKIFNPLVTFHNRRIFKCLNSLNIEKFLDIGAHKGEFLENMLKIEKIKSFYAFEPQKNLFNELKVRFSKNENVTLFNFAMDEKIGTKKIRINKLDMTSSLAEFNDNSIYLKVKNFLTHSRSNYVDEYEVQTKTVDEIFKNINLQNTLIKIDVEGFEMNVIKGSKMKLKEVSFVLVENLFGNHYKNNNFTDIKKYLFQHNFIISKKFTFPTMHFQDVLFKKI